MSRVLFLANHFITLYAFRKELIRKLREDGHEVFLSLPRDDKNRFFEELGCKIVVTAIDRRGVNPINDWKLVGQYKKIIAEVAPDVVFSYTIKPNIYGTWVTNKLKRRQICNVTGVGGTFLKTNLVSAVATLLYRATLKKCYKVFFQNAGDRDYFLKRGMVRQDNWAMLPGSGCNLAEHPLVETPSDDVTKFIFIGRVMELKGVDEYLACAKAIKEKRSDVRFFIAGWNEEPKYKAIVSEYEKKGCVEYLGFCDDVQARIAECHCAILPSRGGEGVPNALLESAATGRACIGAKINGVVDVIEDGKTGFLFEVGDSRSLIEKVERFLDLTYEEKKAMGLAGRKKVEAEFDRQIVVDAYLAEVERVGANGEDGK